MNYSEEFRHLRHNYFVNLMDGAFFGWGIGFTSFTTVLPLFISSMTDSAILIGLIPAIHTIGWQVPQLLTARRVARLPRLKRWVLLTTLHERLPFLGLAVLAWFLPSLQTRTALIIAYLLFIWQGLGAGFTANGWQNMIGKVIPGEIRATFFGFQSSVANLLASLGAFIAGLLLEKLVYPRGFLYCFLLTVLVMSFSFVFLGLTKESSRSLASSIEHQIPLWDHVKAILAQDINFRWFLVSRMLFQFGTMAFAFYTVYAVRHLDMSELEAGAITSVLLITQVIANPLFGWIADRWSRKWIMVLGAVSSAASALLAFWAPELGWFYPVVILQGLANTVFWTIGLAFSLEFGKEEERPTYVGMANTLIAPSAILAPLLGGWLADSAGYPSTFLASTIFSVIAVVVLGVFVQDRR